MGRFWGGLPPALKKIFGPRLWVVLFGGQSKVLGKVLGQGFWEDFGEGFGEGFGASRCPRRLLKDLLPLTVGFPCQRFTEGCVPAVLDSFQVVLVAHGNLRRFHGICGFMWISVTFLSPLTCG